MTKVVSTIVCANTIVALVREHRTSDDLTTIRYVVVPSTGRTTKPPVGYRRGVALNYQQFRNGKAVFDILACDPRSWFSKETEAMSAWKVVTEKGREPINKGMKEKKKRLVKSKMWAYDKRLGLDPTQTFQKK